MYAHIADYSMPVALICLFPSLRLQSLFFPAQRRARGECEKGKKAEASPFGWRCDRVEACTAQYNFSESQACACVTNTRAPSGKDRGVCGVAYLISVPALMEQVRSHYRPVLSILHGAAETSLISCAAPLPFTVCLPAPGSPVSVHIPRPLCQLFWSRSRYAA